MTQMPSAHEDKQQPEKPDFPAQDGSEKTTPSGEPDEGRNPLSDQPGSDTDGDEAEG